MMKSKTSETSNRPTKKISLGRLSLFLLFTLIFIFSAYQVGTLYFAEKHSRTVQVEYSLQHQLALRGTPLDQPQAGDLSTLALDKPEAVQTYQERYAQMKQTNSDFAGWLVFDSGLIDLPFVKAPNNEVYLNQSFVKQPSIHGTVFLDAFQQLNGNNLTLYGHYVYNSPQLMFSPLEKLLRQEEYAANRELHLFLEDEVRHYEVVAVVEYKISDYPVYALGQLLPEDFATYKKYIAEHRVYPTGKEIELNDRLLTLQTCVRNNDAARWLVVAREVKP